MDKATNLSITVQEIYKELCPECKRKIQALIKDKLTDEMVRKALEEGGEVSEG